MEIGRSHAARGYPMPSARLRSSPLESAPARDRLEAGGQSTQTPGEVAEWLKALAC
jgi:hypothetical protein